MEHRVERHGKCASLPAGIAFDILPTRKFGVLPHSTPNSLTNMKTFIALLAVGTLVSSIPCHVSAAEAAAPTKTATPAAKAATATPAAKAVGEAKTLPMNSRADSIDLKARTFTNKRKDGVEVKHVITDKTEIKQGEAPAKLEDIKIGDYVSGSRKKVSETEYTVVKITKFGPKAAKPAADAKPKTN